MSDTVLYVGYTVEEWSGILEALGAHEDTQEIAFDLMDDLALALQDCPNAIRLYDEPVGWRHWALKWFSEQLAVRVDEGENK